MKEDKAKIRNSTAEFLIFTSQEEANTIEVQVYDETVWLSQKLMATLFEVGVNTINYHLKEIFKSEELDEKYRAIQDKIFKSDFDKLLELESEEIK